MAAAHHAVRAARASRSLGAGLEGSPILGGEGSDIEPTILLIPVRRWSDGTPGPQPDAPHQHAK
jgi:hypothetical protein